MTYTTACIQVNAQADMQENIAKASRFIREAQKEGAVCVALPENVALMAHNAEELIANSYESEEHPALRAFQSLAAELQIELLIGSLAVKLPNSNKLANRSFYLGNDGTIIAQYDKIHLYDVDVKGGERHQESARYQGGNQAVLVERPWATIGMTICYDLRFPYLYRQLAKAGAEVLTVPSAFTYTTGQAHWHVLLRARAIETGSFVIAPAQVGSHPANRRTYGHSLIIDPWGEVLADAGDAEGWIVAELDLNRVKQVRTSLPSLQHDRDVIYNS